MTLIRQSPFRFQVQTAKIHALVLALVVCGSVAPLVGEEPADRGAISRRIREEILAGFRQGKIVTPAPDAEAPAEVEPGVVNLPDFTVVERRVPARLDRSSIGVERDRLFLGTGVTEIRGKKITIKTMRILFIPIGLKFEW